MPLLGCRLSALPCRAGVRARRPDIAGPASFQVRVLRREALRPGRIQTGQGGNAPLSLLSQTAPLAGEPSKRQPPKSLPCKGLRSRAPPAADAARRSRFDGRRMQARFSVRSMMRAPQTGRWMRRKAQTEGCGAPPCKYPFGPARSLSRRSPPSHVSSLAARTCPQIVGRAFTPAGKVCGRFAAGEIARPTNRPEAPGKRFPGALIG